MPPPVKMPIRAVRAALVWFRKTTALDGKAGIGAGAAIDPVAPIPSHSRKHDRIALSRRCFLPAQEWRGDQR